MSRCVCGQTLVKETAWEIAQLVRRKGLRLSEIREIFREAQRLLESGESFFVACRREKP